MARVLITGGSSFLGQCLVPLAQAEHTVCYTFFSHDPLGMAGGVRVDVREETAVVSLIHAFQPDVIIHTVGSNRPDDMSAVIVQGTRHVALAAARLGVRLVHISTDAIFDGTAAPYGETAVPTPVNEYGRAKAEAEAIVRRYENHVVVRTSLIYSLKQMDHGTAWMAAALQAGEPVTLFANQVRNPVWVETLSRACLELVGNGYVGVLNVAGRQVLTRAEFALRMLDWWGVLERETLVVGMSDARWPLDCRLDVGRATAVLQTPLWGVDEVLALAAPHSE
ncbi:MAG: SDR family oxidoreductase [Ardenticatenaceae bacterium]|nr:SDR family oxidoreductase [Ardenticatenaceae bacterium]